METQKRRLGFRMCSIHSIGLVGTPLKREFIDEEGNGRCPNCKLELKLEIAEIKIGDICPKCKEAKIKQKKRVIEYCPKCREEQLKKEVQQNEK